MRVVSLACSNTEIVDALGCSDRLVGVDDHSDHPPSVVHGLPRVGPDLAIDVARVAALEPDLILASMTVPGHEQVIENLEQAGLPIEVFEPVSVRDVYRDIHRIARLLDVPRRGDEVVGRMSGTLGDGDRPESPTGAPVVLVQWWPKPSIVPGGRSWTTDVLHIAGGINPLAHEFLKSRPVPDEEVAEIAPDAIVLSWCGVPPAKYRPDVALRNEAWANVPAIRNGRVFCVPEAYLGRPGPRLVEGAQALRLIVAQSRLSSAPAEAAAAPSA